MSFLRVEHLMVGGIGVGLVLLLGLVFGTERDQGGSSSSKCGVLPTVISAGNGVSVPLPKPSCDGGSNDQR